MEQENNALSEKEEKERPAALSGLLMGIGVIAMAVFVFRGMWVGAFLALLFMVAMIATNKDSHRPEGQIPESKIAESTQENSAAKVKKDESSINYELFDDVVDWNILKYKYEDNISLLPDMAKTVSGHGGEVITFLQEPENEYDQKAVAIYLDEIKIGYVYRGRIQDMINDWISKEEKFIGYINKIWVDENKVSYKIGFYRPYQTFENKTFSLIKTKKKVDEEFRREDFIFDINPGDGVTIDYDDELDSYVVHNKCYEEIGELGESAFEFIEDSDSDQVRGVVQSLDYTERGVKMKIIVCLL